MQLLHKYSLVFCLCCWSPSQAGGTTRGNSPQNQLNNSYRNTPAVFVLWLTAVFGKKFTNPPQPSLLILDADGDTERHGRTWSKSLEWVFGSADDQRPLCMERCNTQPSGCRQFVIFEMMTEKDRATSTLRFQTKCNHIYEECASSQIKGC